MSFDPDLSIGKGAAQNIPCRCSSCLNILRNKWDTKLSPKHQPKFSHNKNYKHSKVFGKFHDLKILQVTYKPDIDKDDLSNYKIDALNSIPIQLTTEMTVNGIGSDVKIKYYDQYNVDKWVPLPSLYKIVTKNGVQVEILL